MKRDIAGMWIEALRSGEYQQGAGSLSRGGEFFCCLGVLCDLAVKSGLDIRVEESPGADPEEMPRVAYDLSLSFLPASVANWAGTISSNGAYGDEPNQSLAGDNDNGASFEQIADIIDEFSEEL